MSKEKPKGVHFKTGKNEQEGERRLGRGHKRGGGVSKKEKVSTPAGTKNEETAEPSRELLAQKVSSAKNFDELTEAISSTSLYFSLPGGILISPKETVENLKNLWEKSKKWDPEVYAEETLNNLFIRNGITEDSGIREKAIELLLAQKLIFEIRKNTPKEKTPASIVPKKIVPEVVVVEKLKGKEMNLHNVIDIEGEILPEPPVAVGNETIPTPDDVQDLIDNLGIESLLPEEFEKLNEFQKRKVLQDLERRIVDIVSSDAKTQYSKDFSEKGFFAKIRSSINKEKNIKDLEREIFEKIKNEQEGKEQIKNDLEVLTVKIEDKEVSPDGFVLYLKHKIGKDIYHQESMEEFEAINYFNQTANEFANMPYEWGQEKKGKHRKEYDRAQAEYTKAREEILRLKTSRETDENKGKAMLEVLETDTVLKMEQLLNTHPEFEQMLNDFGKSADFKNQLKDVGSFLNTATGKNLINRLLMAGGFTARAVAKGAAVFTGITGITALGGIAIGGGIGYFRGKLRGKEILTERQKEARHGIKDESKERVVTTEATHLSTRLGKLINEVENAINPEERAKKLSLLAARVEHTQGKIEKGQVNFGDAKSVLFNQFDLVNYLNKALVLKETNSEKINKEIKERIEKLSSIAGEKISEKTSEAQKAFIRKQAWKGVFMGAGFATIGYTVRWAGEQWGWWGNHGAEINSNSNALHTPTETELTHPNSTPVEPNRLGINGDGRVHEYITVKPESASQITTHPVGITFEHGKGGIQGILDLKKQIAEQYHGDYSTTPEGVQEFMRTDATKEAIKLGFYNPGGLEESAKIPAGSVLKFDEHGNLLFGKPDASGNIPPLGEKYHDTMFDSHQHAPAPAEKIVPHEEIKTTTTPVENLETKTENMSAETNPTTETTQANNNLVTPEESKVVEEAKLAEIREKLEQGYATTENQPINNAHRLVNRPIGTTESGRGVNYVHGTGPGSNRGPGYFPQTENLRYNFSDISPEENRTLSEHPEFVGKNPFHLNGIQLMEVVKASQKGTEFLFGENPDYNWQPLMDMKIASFLKLEPSDINNIEDPVLAKLSRTLLALKNFSGLNEPASSGFLKLTKELVGGYIIRALQKLTAEGKLEEFEATVGIEK